MLINTRTHIGIVGSRHLTGAQKNRPRSLAKTAVNCGLQVITGCARGADHAARQGAASHPSRLTVFKATTRQPYHLVQRTIQLVNHLAAQPKPLLVAYTTTAAPSGLNHHTNGWQSVGSGTWSAVALATAKGIPVFIYGHGHHLPVSFGHWHQYRSPCAALHRHWFVLRPAPANANQQSLFSAKQ